MSNFLQVTTAGLAAGVSAAGHGLQMQISHLKLGSGVAYIPNDLGSETGLHGAVLYTTTIGSYAKQSDGSLLLSCVVGPEVGPFDFGELGIFLSDGTMLASLAFDTLQTKYSSLTGTAASSYTFNLHLALGVATVNFSVIASGPSTAARIVISPTVPPTPDIGLIWYENAILGRGYTWTGTTWVDISPGLSTLVGIGATIALPAYPTIGDTYAAPNNVTYNWDGVKWTGTVGGAISSVESGGTGVSTINGIVYGNGTSPMTPATAAQIVGAIGSTPVANATNAVNATNATTAGSAGSAGSASTATSAVNLTGTIASAVTCTTQTLGDNSTKVASTAFVRANGGAGSGQTWTNVLSSRAQSVTYTNTTGKCIEVMVAINCGGGGNRGLILLTLDGVLSMRGSYGYASYISFLVPNGGTYMITWDVTTSGPIWDWLELR